MHAIIDPNGAVVRYQNEPAITAKGWRCLPVIDARPEPAEGEVLEGPAMTVTDAAVERAWTTRPKTHEERLAEVHAARRAAYPPIGDQLDAAFKARNGDETAQQAIDAAIAAVKAAHPKPDA